MTERRGGSDVTGGNDTHAVVDNASLGRYRLYGHKWFSSATDTDMALTLARLEPEKVGSYPIQLQTYSPATFAVLRANAQQSWH